MGTSTREASQYTVQLTHYDGELAKRLTETVDKAQKEAAAHRPPTNAAHLDHNEVEIQSDAEKAIGREAQLFSHVLVSTSKDAHDLQQKVPDVEARIQQLLADDSLQAEAAAELS